MSRRTTFVTMAMLVLCVAVGCAAGPNPSVGLPDALGHTAGFWLGLWHGFISPVTFVVSLLTDSMSFYEVHNSGGWYDFGFVLGAVSLFGGADASTM